MLTEMIFTCQETGAFSEDWTGEHGCYPGRLSTGLPVHGMLALSTDCCLHTDNT